MIANRESYERIAQKAVDKGFITFSVSAREIYIKKVKNFLENYKWNYDNAFARNFETITDIQIIHTQEEFLNKIRMITDELEYLNNDDKGIFILYKIINKEKQFIRIGITGIGAVNRLKRHLQMSFSNTMRLISNLHLDVRALKDTRNFNDKFEYQILCVTSSESKIRALERLFTIYENRYDNDVGYDLSVNNYYNKIVGDLFDYIEGSFNRLHPRRRDVQPANLETAIKECVLWDEIISEFPDVEDMTTIRRRAVLYGFTIKLTGSLMDMRAYFMKPIIEEEVLKKLNHKQVINILISKGFTFLKMLSNDIENRREFLNRICNFIWKSDMHKIGYSGQSATLSRVRTLILFNEALKLARNPKYNTGKKAQDELIRQGVILTPSNAVTMYEGELLKIFKKINVSYQEEQNNILAPILADLLRQDDPDLTIPDITEKFDLDRHNIDDCNLIVNIIYRIFKKYVQEQRNIKAIKNFLRTDTLYYS